METAIVFAAGDLQLQGLLQRMPGENGVIITHPHPLYGGDMYNPVVETIHRVYAGLGFTTLRFNFRGVGGSSGTFADGHGEEDDVHAAIRYLTTAGHFAIQLAGYSFGARVLAGIKTFPTAVAAQIHVAPPLAFMDYSTVSKIEKLTAVISGDDDDIAPAAMIDAILPAWNPAAQHILIAGADHFFSFTMAELEKALQHVVSSALSQGN